MNVKDIFLTY